MLYYSPFYTFYYFSISFYYPFHIFIICYFLSDYFVIIFSISVSLFYLDLLLYLPVLVVPDPHPVPRDVTLLYHFLVQRY